MRGLVSLLAAHPRLTALLGTLAISFSGVLYRLAEVSPETATFFRSLYGLPLLLAAAYFERRERGPLPSSGVCTAFAYAGYLIVIRHVGGRRSAEPVAISTSTTLVVALAVGMALGTLDLVPAGRPTCGWSCSASAPSRSATC